MYSTEAIPAESRSASRTVRFEDPRSPVEIRSLLEWRLMAPFDPDVPEGRLDYRGVSKCNGLPCRSRLVYLSAAEGRNANALDLHMSWDHVGAQYHEHCGKSSAAWFDLWTAGFEELAAAVTASGRISHTPSTATCCGLAPSADYSARVEDALAAEWMLSDAAAIQREIVAALRNGASFATAHKE